MRVVTYNVLRARRSYRLRDISHEIHAHIFGLTGTRLPFYRPWDGSAHKSAVTHRGRHFEVRWGYEQTRCSNMADGVSILVNKKLWKPKHAVRMYDAPSRLQGRAGAVSLQNWQEDVTAIVMYWPPKPQDMSSRASYAETLHSLAEWLRKTLQDTPKGCTPCIMTDLSDWMGVPRNDKEDQAVTGDLFPEKEGLAATLFRVILQEEEMTVINTFQGGEATFASTRGTLTRIYYIASPADLLARLRLCRVLFTTGIRLQLVRSTQRHDHSPVLAVFQRDQWKDRARDEPAWSAEASNACWMTGWKRRFVAPEAIQKKKAEFDRLVRQ